MLSDRTHGRPDITWRQAAKETPFFKKGRGLQEQRLNIVLGMPINGPINLYVVFDVVADTSVGFGDYM